MKARFNTIAVSLVAACALLLAPVLSTPVLADSYPFQTTDPEVIDALDYLYSEQDTDGAIGGFGASAWVVIAIAAAGEDPHDWKVDDNPSIIDYLATNASDADSATDYARMLLAIVAASEDPNDFGGRDFVSLLESTYDGSQIGDDTLLNDDFWGVMGLIASGESPSSDIISNCVAFILSNQNGDGGWSWGVGAGSDVDDTAAAVMALIAAGEPPSSTAVTDALAYIKSTQMASGGFESWGSTNADTDSWGIDAIVAAEQDPTDTAWASGSGNDSIDDLLTFRQPDGSFYWQIDNPGMSIHKTTACAITALLGKPFPIAVLTPEGVTIGVRVEGQGETVWDGSVTVTESQITATNSGTTYHLEDPTALGALDEASQAGDFSYETTDEYGSLYVTSINGEEPEGMSGWLYRVDYLSPMVGAADFILDETTPPDPPHHEVLFYYGEWGEPPLKIEVDKTEVDVDESFTATVTYYDDATQAWSPLDKATVHADQNYTTGANGTVDITVDTDMTLNIYAEKDGFIRSNRITVTVGTGTGGASEVGLTADIMPAISFTVDPSSIDFGELGPRDTSDLHTISITNTGTWALLISCTVSDDANDLYADGLKLDEEMWDLFNASIARDNSQDTDVTLTVPENYSGVGEQGGAIIFWASEAP
ncbi:MAG: DUF4430 domain-containing protein [Chloroflexi bacterium]|nr:DUF4430 domain-containing protein [Chloroflexota bacterium]